MSTKKIKKSKSSSKSKIKKQNIEEISIVHKDNKDNKENKDNKDSEKYKVALKLINVILVNSGKETIDDLTKFKDIDKEDIIKEVNKKGFEDMEDELFKNFDKGKCGWYRRKRVDTYILHFMRCMCVDLGLSLEYVEQKKQQDNNTLTILYTII